MQLHLIRAVILVVIAGCNVSFSQSAADSIGEKFTEENLLPHQFVALSLAPSEPSQSALTHRLYPENSTLFDRNSAIYYHRSVYILDTSEARLRAQDNNPDTTLAFSKDYLDGELTPQLLQRMRTWLQIHEYTLKEIGFAVRSNHCDWQLIPEEARDNWYFLHVSELQSCRALARLLAVKARVEIADGNFDKAIEAIQFCNKMAADVHRSKLIVGSMVGNSCAGIMQRPIQEFMQAKDSPSLYWPLATLPNEVTDVRQTVRNQLSRTRNGDGLFANPENPKTLDEWRVEANKYINRLVIVQAINGRVNVSHEVTIRCYPIAKQLLLNDGMPPNELEAMPSIQVVAIARSRISNWMLDELEKGLRLNDLECQKYFAKLESRVADHPFNTAFISELSLTPSLDVTLAPIQQLLQSTSYLQRKRCAFQVIEAIRLHLGATGELPKSLDEITIVPVPLNPETGKPFRYEFKDKEAKLFDFGLRKVTATVYEITPEGK